MKAKLLHHLTAERIAEIRGELRSRHAGYYGLPCGATHVLTQTGEMKAGFAEEPADHSGFVPFRWLRSSGTYIRFDAGILYVAGSRHSIDEFLDGIMSADEIASLEVLSIESRQPDRAIGDTIKVEVGA
jgi:hypothetical protein